MKRVTIYDIARELNLAPSTVSKAMNNKSSVSEQVSNLVKAKAKELNYKHNLNAANLRTGSSKIIAVVVPKINVSFFADVIAGMEEVCYENNHRLIICQSDESYIKEVQNVQTLIQQNVDCILISLSIETTRFDHLQEVLDHEIVLIQFDRVNETICCDTIVNDNKQAAYMAVKHLIKQGYKQIAFLGGPDHLSLYRDRKEGYLKAVEEAGLNIPYQYVQQQVTTIDAGMQKSADLLKSAHPPDSFFAISDNAALGILNTAKSLGLKVPKDLGIIGFANEKFSELVTPTISSINQNSRVLGREAANIYFDRLNDTSGKQNIQRKSTQHVVKTSLIIRESSSLKQTK